MSLNQHSLYVRVVEKPPPPPLTGEQYGKMEPKYPEGGHCQSVLTFGNRTFQLLYSRKNVSHSITVCHLILKK